MSLTSELPVHILVFPCYQAFSAFFYIHSFLQRVTGITVSTPWELEEAIKTVCRMRFNEVMFPLFYYCI